MQLYKSALAALALGTMAVSGCSTDESTAKNPSNSETAGLGAVGMALVLPDDSQITNVNFTITGPGGYNRTGVVPVGNSSKLTFRVGNLPLGNGYVITLAANTSFGEPCASAPTTFNVLDNLTTTVAVSLQCQATDNRADLIVNGAFESCPLVTSLEAIPAEVYVGGSMSFAALISHGDSTVTWSATGGSFSAVSSLAPYVTTYTCPLTEGVQTITATVTGSGATCNDTLTMTVECTQNPGCGNGTIDTADGEVCDNGPLNSDTGACKTNCQPASCGDGFLYPTDEECDAIGLPTATCNAACEPIVCGDGAIEGLEICDDGNTVGGDGCSALCLPEGCGDGVVILPETCDLGAANSNTGACTLACRLPACGDTFVQAGEQCDPPNGTTCSATCQNLAAYGDDAHAITSCRTCRGDGRVGQPAGQCSDIGGFGLFDAPALCFNNADPVFVQQCQDLRNCIDTSNIGYGPIGPIESFCGAAPLATCSTVPAGDPGGAAGPCVDEWFDACRTTNLTVLTGSIGDLSLPCGIANAITECDVAFCPTCITP